MTKAQELQLDLIRLASFNNFDGDRVANDLIDNRDLWVSCFMTRFGGGDLIALRDLDVAWNVDTLYMMVVKSKEDKIKKLIDGWWVDSIRWLTRDEAQRRLGCSPVTESVVELWWD